MNVRDNTYKLIAILENGNKIDLTKALISLKWSDNEGELAQRATITLAQTKTEEGFLTSILKLCVRLQIVANEKTVFEGLIWTWDYTSSDSQEFDITAYDNMIYMQKSKDNNYFAKGKSTQTIVSEICKKWDIPLSYNWESYKHKKTVYRGQTIANQIVNTLEDAKYKVDKRYVIRYLNNKLCIEEPGLNEDVYMFESEKGTAISTKHSITLDGLVTKVIITGKESSSGKVPIKATVNGKLEYGTLQDMVSSSNSSTSEAKEEAERILKERGKPEENITLEAPDIPTLRKGDKIKVIAGTLNGYYFIVSITHNANDRAMTLKLEVESDGL